MLRMIVPNWKRNIPTNKRNIPSLVIWMQRGHSSDTVHCMRLGPAAAGWGSMLPPPSLQSLSAHQFFIDLTSHLLTHAMLLSAHHSAGEKRVGISWLICSVFFKILLDQYNNDRWNPSAGLGRLHVARPRLDRRTYVRGEFWREASSRSAPFEKWGAVY